MAKQESPSGEETGIDFTWEEDDPLTPEQRLEKLAVPIGKTAHLGEEIQRDLSKEFKQRLDELKVEDSRTMNRWQLRRNPELLMTGYLLDDVHYAVYEKRRQKTGSPFVSVNFNDILSELKIMADTHVDGALLQRQQTQEAHTHLVDLGLSDESLYRMIGQSSNERFLVRSLSRLLREPSMDTFARKLSKEAMERGNDRPLTFEEVASRAIRKVEHIYKEHTLIDRFGFSTDENMWHLLVAKDLERARGFAAPIAGYVASNQE
ncbi:MAG TPA: hypothetical protein VI336_01370 [Candidatus Saccharimonadales bacterium]|nr:hypothetical protein [Candidatus Saccharimonadales bacterium]